MGAFFYWPDLVPSKEYPVEYPMEYPISNKEYPISKWRRVYNKRAAII